MSWRSPGSAWRIRFPLGATAATVVVTAALWELAARIANVSFIPPLGEVLARLWQLTVDGQILDDLSRSLTNLVIGFGISVVFGTAIGVAMGLSKKVEAALEIYVYALLTTPTLIFAPVFFAIFGLSSASIIALIVLYAILYIIINTAAAMDSAPIELLEMARSFNASRRVTFFRIRLPAAMPLVMAGYRVAIARAVRGMINGEMFIAATGLGALVIQAGARFDATTVLAILILIIVIAYVAIELVGFIDRRLTGWLPSNQRVGGF
jgi:ABC-type nitrate/sulfonate/bicarbonate transport system permease component